MPSPAPPQVTLSLSTVLSTEEGRAAMETQLQKEYSEENINFWKQARIYRETAAEERAALAGTIVETYIKETAEFQVLPWSLIIIVISSRIISTTTAAAATTTTTIWRGPSDLEPHTRSMPSIRAAQVNIPAKMRTATLTAYEEAQAAGTFGDELFAEPEEEIFTLMDRDTWARLKADPTMVKSMAASYFEAADKNKDGVVTFHEYRTWALANPQVLSFFSQVQKSVAGLLGGSKIASSEEAPPAPPAEAPAEAQ